MNYDTLSHMRHSRFDAITVTLNVWFRLTSPIHTMPYSLLVQETTWDVQLSPQAVEFIWHHSHISCEHAVRSCLLIPTTRSALRLGEVLAGCRFPRP